MTQVLIVSITLSTVGAMFGVAAGLGIATFIAAISPLPAAVSLKWIMVGVGLGTSVGITAGVYPASQASKLNPVDALRYE
jgi:putative ABC transport system permease protein